MKPCTECKTPPTLLFGHAPKAVHTPSCTQGRCGATHNGVLPDRQDRCVKRGSINHGDNHEDTHGNRWEGEFITLDRMLEERDH